MKSESASESDEGESGLAIVLDNTNDCQIDDLNNICSDSVIESLWGSKNMGNYGPEEILVALWFYISHYFGLSSRMDHAKLCLGNVVIEIDNNGRRKLVFNRDFQSTAVFNTRFPSMPIYELSVKEKCPVAIYETYLRHRLSSSCQPGSPFYLQPDKTAQVEVGNTDSKEAWFTASALGKNRIGSLFNSTLTKCGQPSIRHYSSRRQLLVAETSNLPQHPDPLPQPVVPDIASNEPKKIRLKISHLNSGNPIVTQTHSDDFSNSPSTTTSTPPVLVEHHPPKTKKKSLHPSHQKIAKPQKSTTVKLELTQNIRTFEEDIYAFKADEEKCVEDTRLKKQKQIGFDIPCKLNYHRGHRRGGWGLQKSIIMVTSKETNPILRQLMMHLGMAKDILLPQDIKVSPSKRSTSCTETEQPGSKMRTLRNRPASSQNIHHLQLPRWSSPDQQQQQQISELQKSMEYSFDCDDCESIS